VDPLKEYTPEQQALIEQLRDTARKRAAIEEAADAAKETQRRLQASGLWRRLRVSAGIRCWSTAAWFLFALSKQVKGSIVVIFRLLFGIGHESKSLAV